jgi:chromosome segregation ATPase
MPLTKQIIQEAIRESIKTEVGPKFEAVNSRFKELDARFEQVDARFEQVDARFDSLETKIDNLTNLVVEFAGNMKNLQEDHDVLSGQVANRTDRLEKVELKVFGSIQVA